MMKVVELECEVEAEGTSWKADFFYRDSMLLNGIELLLGKAVVSLDVSGSIFPGASFSDMHLVITFPKVVQFLRIDRQYYEPRGLERVFGDAAYGFSMVDVTPDFFGLNSQGSYFCMALYDELILIQSDAFEIKVAPPVDSFKLLNH